MHVFKCAACGKEFSTPEPTGKCPHCGSRVLIHVSGDPLKKGSCSGSCSSCGG